MRAPRVVSRRLQSPVETRASHRNRFARWTVAVRAAIQSREGRFSPFRWPASVTPGPEECDFRGEDRIWRLVNDWVCVGEGRMSNIPAEKDAGTVDPSWRQSLRGKASGTYRCAAACARRLCVVVGSLDAWRPKSQFAPQTGALWPWGPQTNPQISWTSLIPSPSLFSSAPSTPRSPTGFVGKVYS